MSDFAQLFKICAELDEDDRRIRNTADTFMIDNELPLLPSPLYNKLPPLETQIDQEWNCLKNIEKEIKNLERNTNFEQRQVKSNAEQEVSCLKRNVFWRVNGSRQKIKKIHQDARNEVIRLNNSKKNRLRNLKEEYAETKKKRDQHIQEKNKIQKTIDEIQNVERQKQLSENYRTINTQNICQHASKRKKKFINELMTTFHLMKTHIKNSRVINNSIPVIFYLSNTRYSDGSEQHIYLHGTIIDGMTIRELNDELERTCAHLILKKDFKIGLRLKKITYGTFFGETRTFIVGDDSMNDDTVLKIDVENLLKYKKNVVFIGASVSNDVDMFSIRELNLARKHLAIKRELEKIQNKIKKEPPAKEEEPPAKEEEPPAKEEVPPAKEEKPPAKEEEQHVKDDPSKTCE